MKCEEFSNKFTFYLHFIQCQFYNFDFFFLPKNASVSNIFIEQSNRNGIE